MAIFYLRDTRVSGATPQCDIAAQVTPSTFLRTAVEDLVNRIMGRYNEPAWFHSLPRNAARLANRHPVCGQLNRRSMFSPLQGKVGNIEIHGCSAAAIYNRGSPCLGPYDGAAFCSEMAKTSGANLMASDATLFYIPSASITNLTGTNQLARWQGNVGTWNPQGQLIGFTTPAQRGN